MSKFELRERAHKAGGATYEESLKATQLVPSLYERLGRESGMEELSRLFYDRVFDDSEKKNQWFLSIFASSTKAEAIDNQYRFFVQTFGGPDLYRQKGKGRFTRLSGRHANYHIGHRAADRWVMHMEHAMNEHPKLNHVPTRTNGDRRDGGGDNNANKNHDITTTTADVDDDDDAIEAMIAETKEAMRAYFRYTAHYIVVSSEYMRDDQLSGGTRIDEGRVW
jgi:truncated hemoglobin YjbI